MLVYAHRGSSRRQPENTMAAFRTAMEEGASGIETDLRLTRDRVIVLLHDASLHRVAGDPRLVSDVSWAELKAVNLRRGHRVPALEELWDLAAQRSRLNLEIKDPEVVPELVRFLHHRKGDILVTSFDFAVVAAVRQSIPGVAVGPVLERLGSSQMDQIRDRGYNAVSLSVAGFSSKVLDFCREQGMELLLWVVNRPRRVLHFARIGVSGVFTDCPGAAVEALRARGCSVR